MSTLLSQPASRSSVKLSARQFEQMPDPPAAKLELVNGELFVHSSPKPPHGRLLVRLSTMLENHVEANDLGMVFADVNTVFDDYNVRRPDILYFRKQRTQLVDAQSLGGLPDLAIEIVSPSSTEVDRRHKFEQYALAGIPHYWIVDPSMQSIEGYELRGGEYQLANSGRDDQTVSLPPFDDLALPLAKLWWVGQ